METCCFLHPHSAWFFVLLGVLVAWEMVWKAVAMWKAAKNNHLAWFVCIIIFNTIGILSIVYILMHRKK